MKSMRNEHYDALCSDHSCGRCYGNELHSELPGMWEQADLFGGKADSSEGESALSENQGHEDLGFLEEKPGKPMQEYNKDYHSPYDADAYPYMIKDAPPVVPIKVDDQSSIDHAYDVARGHANKNLNDYATQCRLANDTWWRNPETGRLLVDEGNPRPKERTLLLAIGEISEAYEGIRKDKMDDHLPHRKAEEVELVDALIRIFDHAGEYDLDLEGAFREKMQYNAGRKDHKPANRLAEGGKQF